MVKFGVQFWQEEFDIDGLKNAWLMAEEMGFESAWLYDHFYPMSSKTSWSILEPWTILPLLAAETTCLRLGVLVTCNSYRFPPVLAKIAASVDVCSNGRLDFGIGAGWHQTEYKAYGIDFPEARIRIRQLAESVEIIKRVWTEDAVSFHGKYYTVDNLVSNPKPVQKPHPPIWIGGKGDSVLKVVVSHADYANLVNCSVEEYKERMDVLRKHSEALGRNFKSINKTWHGIAVVADEKEARRKVLKHKANSAIRRNRMINTDTYLSRAIVGTPDQCIDKIQQYVELGVTYFIPHFPFSRELENLQFFMNEVAASFT